MTLVRCDSARDLLLQRSFGELDSAMEGELEAHLAACPPCRAFDAEQNRLSASLDSLRNLAPLPSQRQAVLARLSTARRQALANRITRGAVGLAAAAVLGLAAFGVWRGIESRMDTATRVVTESTELARSFLEEGHPGAGWVATAGLPAPGGKSIAYLYLEPAFGDRVHASILLKHPDGRVTREIAFGPVSFGRAPFTQPEFDLLSVGGRTLLAIVTDDEKAAGSGGGRLWVFRYDDQARRLALVPFDGAGNSLSVTGWPLALSGGIQTVNGNRAVTWNLAENGKFARQFGGDAGPGPPAGDLLAEAKITIPGGSATVQLRGTLIGEASVYLIRPDGQPTEEIQLGRPHFGGLEMTRPALRKVPVGQTEVLVLLSDPLRSLPQEAVVRAVVYDPVRSKLRLVPFTNGEVLVDEPPAAADGMLTTVHNEYRPEGLRRVEYRWRLAESWLLEKAGERVFE